MLILEVHEENPRVQITPIDSIVEKNVSNYYPSYKGEMIVLLRNHTKLHYDLILPKLLNLKDRIFEKNSNSSIHISKKS